MNDRVLEMKNQGVADTMAPQETDDWRAHYKRPSPASHAGGHTEPETEPEKELQEYLHFRLRFANASPKDMPMLREIDFLLQHGRFYSPRPLPKGLNAGRRHGCYLVSQLHAANADDLTYVEGYGLLSIATPHAWCIDVEGQVIDRTWTGRRGRSLGRAYFGVPLVRSYVKELLIARRFADAFLMPAAFVE